MDTNSPFFRRTGRTQRMIEAAIKNATGKNESGKPKDVIIVTHDRNIARLFRQMREYLSKTFHSSAFNLLPQEILCL